MKVTPLVAQNTSGRSSAIDGRTTRHAGYAVSQRIRKRIEEAFGWIKMVAGLEQTKFRGRDRVGWAFSFAATAYNLTRLPKLLAGVGMSAPPNSTAAGGSSRPTFAIAIISLSVHASDKRPPIGILLQRPASLTESEGLGCF